jgi:four helix bundle protein
LDWGTVGAEMAEMNEQEFKRRTKQLGVDVIKLLEQVPSSRALDVIARQLLRCATSVGANYRAACRGKSNADVIAKLSVVEEEADETLYWLEVLSEAGLVPAHKLSPLVEEANAILAMTVASIKTLRTRRRYATPEFVTIQNPKSKIQNPSGSFP